MSEIATKTVDEIKAQSKLAVAQMFGEPIDKTPEPKDETLGTPPAEKPPETPPAATPATPPAAPAATPPIAPPAAPAAPVAPAPAPAAPATPEATPVAPVAPVEMGAEDKADYDVLVALADYDPAYAEKAQQFAEFTRKNYEYQDAWLAKNPGKEFNPDDDEHTAWYEANQIITADELKEAKDELRIVKIAEKRVGPAIKKIEEKEQDELMAKTAPAIIAVGNKKIAELVNGVHPEIGKLIVDANGTPDFSEAVIKKAEELDPIAAKVLIRMSASMDPLIQELEKSATPGLNYRLNPRNNETHAEIYNFHMKVEDDRAKNPVAGAKPFMRLADFNKQLAEIHRTTPAAKRDAAVKQFADSVSLVGPEDIQAEIVRHYTEEAKKVIGEIDSLGQKKYKPATPAAPTQTPATPPTPAPTTGKPKTPSVGSQSVPVTTDAAGITEQKKLAQSATKQMFG